MVNIVRFMAYGLLTSVATAASVRRDKHHAHHHRRAKVECSESSAPYPIANSTTTPIAISESSSTSADTAPTTQSVVTVSVIPVPIPSSSSASIVASSVYSSPVGVSSAGSSAPAGSAPAGSAPAGTGCGVVTTYVTVQQTVYVTASQAPAPTPKPKHTKKHKHKHSKVPCSSSSSSDVSVPASSSSSVVSVPEPSSSSVASVATPSSSSVVVVVPPPPSAPIATAPMPSSTSAAQDIQSSAPVATTSSAAPAASSTAASTPIGTGPYTGPKMGISWDPSQNYELSSLGLSVPPSWAYDWGQQAHGIPGSIQYVPTLHDASKCAGFASDLSGSGATYVKHFNEPDQTGGGGSGLDVSAAVSLHNQYIAPLMDKYLIGFPAVTSNNIPGKSGTGWLTSFVEQVGSCDGFKFADFHFYGGGEDAATQAKIFMGYVENWISTVDTLCPGKNLPIWISEFAATPVGDEALATAFVKIVGPQLESNPRVGRYAYWFLHNSEIDSVVASVAGDVGL